MFEFPKERFGKRCKIERKIASVGGDRKREFARGLNGGRWVVAGAVRDSLKTRDRRGAAATVQFPSGLLSP